MFFLKKGPVTDKYETIKITTTRRKGSILKVEVCFVMDCTGSMGKCIYLTSRFFYFLFFIIIWIKIDIQAGKDQITRMAHGLQSDIEKLEFKCELRVGFVGYRDYHNGDAPGM